MENQELNTITLEDGRVAVLGTFSALEGYEIKQKFIQAHDSRDYVFRRELLVQALSHVTIAGVPLFGEGAINAQCGDWSVATTLYDAVLAHNGITVDLIKREKQAEYEAIGADLGTGFIAEVCRIYGPLLEIANKVQKGE